VPVAGPGIRAGLLLAWLRAFGEYGATVLLAYHPSSLPIYTYTQFSGSGLANTEAPTALALVVAAVVVTIGRVRLPRRRRSRAALPAPAVPGPGAPVSVRFELEVKAGTFRLGATHRASTHRLAILGPSGSGKSLTLRSIAGLLGADAGPVWYGADPVRYEPVESRQIGYVPQGYQLIPHLNVRDQVCFGVGADPALASYWLETFRLGALIDRLPQELSGGQRQRVCLAQALARKPRLILLDEPFSALDAPVRAELQQELRRLQHRVGLSSVLVTHDPEEAALLADEILVLLEGRLVQSGTPGDLHGRPAGPEVARLLGISNVFSGHTGPDGRLEAAGLRLGVAAGDSPPGTRVQWCIHPEHVDVGSSGAYLAEVVDAADLGPATALELRLGSGLMIRARCSKRRSWSPGQECRVDLPPDAITVWPDGRAGDASALDPGSLDGRFVGP
jgi:molybdate transport system permease protein